MAAASDTLDLICMGEPLYELTFRDLGALGEAYVPGYGGDSSNCAIAAARQGAAVGYLSALGRDRFGDAFMALWQAEGIDTGCVARHPSARTGIYFIVPSPDGRNFTYFRDGSAASLMRPEDLPRQCIASARFLHVSGISQAISAGACEAVLEAMVIAKAAGRTVSYDTNLRLALWPLEQARMVIHSAAAQAQILLPSLDDSRLLTGLEEPDRIVDFYLRLGADIVALKLGRDGAIVATSEARWQITGHAVQSVDATGAGDAFDGAFLARLGAGDSPECAGRYANAAAALTTTGYGAVTPIPRAAEVENFLAA